MTQYNNYKENKIKEYCKNNSFTFVQINKNKCLKFDDKILFDGN